MFIIHSLLHSYFEIGSNFSPRLIIICLKIRNTEEYLVNCSISNTCSEWPSIPKGFYNLMKWQESK